MAVPVPPWTRETLKSPTQPWLMRTETSRSAIVMFSEITTESVAPTRSSSGIGIPEPTTEPQKLPEGGVGRHPEHVGPGSAPNVPPIRPRSRKFTVPSPSRSASGSLVKNTDFIRTRSAASTSWSLSRSESQRFPYPSALVSRWLAFGTSVQLSTSSPMPSRSVSAAPWADDGGAHKANSRKARGNVTGSRPRPHRRPMNTETISATTSRRKPPVESAGTPGAPISTPAPVMTTANSPPPTSPKGEAGARAIVDDPDPMAVHPRVATAVPPTSPATSPKEIKAGSPGQATTVEPGHRKSTSPASTAIESKDTTAGS